MKICRLCNLQLNIECFAKRRAICRSCRGTQQKTWRHRNYNKVRQQELKWQKENAKHLATIKRQYQITNKKKLALYDKNYLLQNRKHIIERTRVYRRRREKVDINFKLANYLRSRLTKIVSNNQKVGSAIRDLGCSVDDFKAHLESKFQLGMTWDNYGSWHIDHIKPLSSFNLANLDEFKTACHYTNLQPLWAKDNLVKSSKYQEIICTNTTASPQI
jgi:hypothetical protein